MQEWLKFYIGGRWVDPVEPRTLDVIDPSTEQPFARVSAGGSADVHKAVAAAKAAFPAFSQTSVAERVALLERISAVYQKRMKDIAEAISSAMGAPMWLALEYQVPLGLAHFVEAARYLREYSFETRRGASLIRKEPIGVCGLITPWNWPQNQIACKVAPALAAGCTVVLKPSELTPLDALLFAEVLHEAGVPQGVFNLVQGEGAVVGEALASHPEVDMVSFTGSTRAGVQVARAAAPAIKRVALELGGKSPNIILPDAEVETAVAGGVALMMLNSGQSCNAPSRMFVPRSLNSVAKAIAKAAAERIEVQAPKAAGPGAVGPVASKAQFEKIQRLIAAGIEEGATLLTGGLGRPAGRKDGYYVKPTVFADCTNQMAIAREEIFGPVLVMIPYDDVDEAVELANDTPYGLAAYVSSRSLESARSVARRIRAGSVHLNGAGLDFKAPFGGYKQSGNGREWGVEGMEEYLEVKALLGNAG
jgi:aldehyde dehydrogenase (NAD+)